MAAPAFFFREDANQKCFQGEGVTRDISLQGAFILTATSPPAECSVQLELLLPPVSGMDAILRIIGTAKVIRSERRSGEKGVNGFAVVSYEQDQWGLTAIQSRSGVELAPRKSVALKAEVN